MAHHYKSWVESQPPSPTGQPAERTYWRRNAASSVVQRHAAGDSQLDERTNLNSFIGDSIPRPPPHPRLIIEYSPALPHKIHLTTPASILPKLNKEKQSFNPNLPMRL